MARYLDRYGSGFGDKLRYLFREREFYVRSEGMLKHVVIRPRMLVCGTVAGLALLAWVGLTTTSFVFRDHAYSRVQSVRVSYEDRIAAIQDRVDEMSDRLLLDQDAYLREVDLLRDEFAELVRRHHRLETFFEQGWMPEADETSASSTSEASASETRHDAASSTDVQKSTERQREGFWRSDQQEEFRTAEEAQRPLREVEILFADLVDQQIELLDRVVEMSTSEADAMRRVFKRLGMDPDRVLTSTHAAPSAMGGPLLPVQQGDAPQDELDERILEAHRRFREAEQLRYAVTLLPIRLPIERDYRLSSGFGFRRDPFTDVVAMHAGVDLKADEGTAVVATADGRVVRAENAVAYGKVVDIEHDNGVMTRYAHLSEIDVEEGQRVRTGQRVGRVGTTGRSTGPHLHYEARIDGRPIDPYQFLRVARDVLQ